MIHVSQGHEYGIGLEVFIKALLLLPKELSSKFILHAERECLEKTFESINVEYQISKHGINFEDRFLDLRIISSSAEPISTSSLNSALNSIQNGEVLFTLPTSKDQLVLKGTPCSGYTEYFRKKFKQDELTMVFKGTDGFTLLLSDHIPLAEVSSFITKDLVIAKSKVLIEGLKKYFSPKSEFIYSGINPHAGENGILGSEDIIITKAIEVLESIYPDIQFKGPLPGDTLHFEKSSREEKVFLYAFHDQGLTSFKDNNGLLGINITMGLPFLRLSVDHGTAFSLYGKNKADCRGCLYGIKEAIRIIS